MEMRHNNVLVVDDNPAFLRLITAWLKGAQYEVRQAGDGLQALAAVEAECPDFLITGWEMPYMDGPELCRRVRAMSLGKYVYIVFMSARDKSDDVIDGLEAGADDFVTKPFKKNHLYARMLAGFRVLELERRLSAMAKSDAMTGLPTRRVFFEQCEREWSRADRYHLPLSCVMFDIDFFKRINDTYGHPVGDKVIKNVARLLVENCRTSDSMARYAGDEFIVLLPETDEKNAAIWAERLREKIINAPVEMGGVTHQVTCSFGVAGRLDDIENAEELVDLADQTLLLAKQSGRDCVACYETVRARAGSSGELESIQGAVFGSATAADVMTPMTDTLRQDDPIQKAVQFFLTHQISSAAVADATGRLAGVLSEKDLTDMMLWSDAWDRPIEELMRPNVVAYEENTSALQIYEFLSRVTIGRVIVVRGCRPVGYVSRASLLRWLNDRLVIQTQDESRSGAENTATKTLATVANSMVDEASKIRDRIRRNGELSSGFITSAVSRIQAFTAELLMAFPSPTATDVSSQATPDTDEPPHQSMTVPKADDAAGQGNIPPLTQPYFPEGCQPELLSGPQAEA